MKLPLVRLTVRRLKFTATIFVATFGGFTHVIDSVALALFTPVVNLPVETDDQKQARAGDPDEARRAQIKEYYPRWVGVRAPELGQEGRDHDGKPVTLTSFRGKRVLLFSFNAGDFHRAPDEKAVLANLRALDKAVKTVGRENLAVVGFTHSDHRVKRRGRSCYLLRRRSEALEHFA